MLRALFAISLIMTPILAQSVASAAEDELRFASGLGALQLFMRHTAPTKSRRGPPVLIIHGATFPSANAAGWRIEGRSWMDELASAGYDVYALDFLGYGESDRYPEMTSDDPSGAPLGDVASMVRQVESAVAEILKARGGSSVDIIAHSAGTFVAARYAELHSQRVAKLVLFGAPAPYGPRSDGAASAARYFQSSRADQLDSFEPRVRDAHHLDLAMFDTWAQSYLATDVHSAQRSPVSVRVPAGLAAAANEMSRSGQLPYDPAKVNVPTLVIQGEWDAVSPPAAGLFLFERLASPLKRLVIISQAGHRAHLERNRQQLYREAQSFLDEPSP